VGSRLPARRPDAAAGADGGRRTVSRPQLTPAHGKRRARIANPPEERRAANCLPPGMPGIMGQPYPMEFLLTGARDDRS
jgi:hypothetical protein